MDNDFVAFDKYHVIIPYSDLEKMVKVVHEMEEIKAQNKRIMEMYSAIRGMFSECLEKIGEIQALVKD